MRRLYGGYSGDLTMNAANSQEDVTAGRAARPRPRRVVPALLLVLVVSLIVYLRIVTKPAVRIGATTVVTEVSSGLALEARVDTGAEVCSIHVEAMEIPGESSDPKANIGETARLLLKNGKGETRWINARVADYTPIRTADYSEGRYYVHLTLRLGNVQKTVLATLNDRTKMKHPLLLGRNFLRHDFVVDVALDSDDIE